MYLYNTDLSGNTICETVFKGIAVLETAVVSSLQGTTPPVWAGVWLDGNLAFQDMVRIKDRLFFWCKSATGNKLVELVEHSFDYLYGTYRKVKSRVYTKSLGADELSDKEIVNLKVEVPYFDIKAGFTINSYFKAQHVLTYTKMQTVTFNTDVCSLNSVPAGIKEINLGGPGDLSKKCDVSFNKNFGVFRKGQVMLEFVGDWALDSILLRMQTKQESVSTDFNCKTVVSKLNTRDCSFVTDWDIKGEKYGTNNC